MRSSVCSLTTAVICFVLSLACSQETLDKETKYFGSTFFTCRSDAVNITSDLGNFNIDKLYWILTDGSVINKDTLPLGKKVHLSDNAFNISFNDVDDELFGYYICVVVFKDKTIKIVRRGLNINGADFSDLREEYRKQAIVGGVAAAVMFGLLALTCIVWHFRYGNRQRDKHEDLDKNEEHIMGYNNTIYDNADPDQEDIIVSIEATANGPPSVDEKM